MERNQSVKMEDVFENSSFSDFMISNSFPFQSLFDFSTEADAMMPLGFMELLGVQDLNPLFSDVGGHQAPSLLNQQPSNPCSTKKIESPEVFNQPATPNYSSISSASSEAVNDEPVVDQEEDQQKTKKQLKVKKTNQKRQKQPRFAFMTKSEVDHLEDGYRWRKYGQKAVKNSTFPRSYYRCTTTTCNVKKRVERSFSDPSIVITTYEGQHTHPSPTMPRSGTTTLAGGAAHLGSGMAMQRDPSHYHHQPFANNNNNNNNNNNTYFAQNGSFFNTSFVHERRFCSPGGQSNLFKDHGLLQDILPSDMLKEE